MSINSKSRRRVRILIIAAILIGLCGAIAVILRKRHIEQMVLHNRDLGYAALESGDYFSALHKIGPYVQRHPADATALARYALARRNVEEPNGKHLADAISVYRRVLELNPEDAEAREQLLEIYLAVGFNTEIKAATEGRTDAASLRARAIACVNLKEEADAREKASEYLKINPTDLQMQMFWIDLMRQNKEPVDSIIAYADEVTRKHAEVPGMGLLRAYALAPTDRHNEAIQIASAATTQPLSKAQDVRIAVNLLDSLGLHDQATDVLVRAAALGKEPAFQASVIARLYQSRQFSQLDQTLAKLGASDEQMKAEIVAYKALSLRAQGRNPEAEQIAAALARRTSDFAARAWSAVLTALPADGAFPDDQKIIEACRDGLRGEGDNAFFRLHLGDAFDRLGETELATTEWVRAATLAPTWDEPLIRLIRLTIVAGSRTEAQQLAARLKSIAPNSPQALAMVAAAQARVTNRQDPAAVAELNAAIDRVQSLNPGEPNTLQFKVDLLALTGHKDQAINVVTQSLAADRTLSVAAYLALARASEARQLGLEAECFRRCEEAHGANLDLAIARALWQIRNGQASDGIASFDKAMQQAPDRGQISWRLAWAQLLEQARDDRSQAVWTELASTNAGNPTVQRSALTARSIRDNRELMRQAIDCLKKVIGDEGLAWRLAEAQWILQGTSTAGSAQDVERELVKATTILNDLAGRYPNHVGVREMLSDCLVFLGKREAAIEHLSAAARLSPGAYAPAIRVAELLQSVGDFERARPYIEQAERILERAEASDLALDAPTPTTQQSSPLRPGELNRDAAWRSIASLYVARGDAARAVAILQRVGDAPDKDTDLAMAQILARRGELSDEACLKLLQTASLSAIETVAEQYARSGRTSEALAVLAKLDSVDAQPGQRELVRGMYHQRRLAFAEAIPQLESATTQMPVNESAWRSLLQCLILEGQADKTVDVATRARDAIPGGAAFPLLVQNAPLVRETVPIARLRPLVAALLLESENAAVVLDALTICRDGNAAGKTSAEVLRQLAPLADRAPRVAVLQYLVADLNRAVGNNDAAIAVMGRLMQLLPADPLPAQRTVELLAATGRWDQLIPIAQQWRKRLGAATLPADEALAAAYVSTRQYSEALAQLQPYALRAAAAPADWSRILVLQAQALVGQGRIPQAESLLFPVLPASVGIRRGAVQIAVGMISDAPVALSWMEKVTAAVPASEIGERLGLAQAWMLFSTRPGQESLRQRADAQLAELTAAITAAPDATSDQWLALGMLKESRADDSGAIDAYRKAIKIDPRQNVAKNNLAMLLIRQEVGNIEEPLRLAQEAANDDRDPAQAEFLDTLGQVQLKANNPQAAAKSFRRAIELVADNRSLLSSNLSMRGNLVQALIQAGEQDQARKELNELEGLASAARQSDGQLDARLKALAESLKPAATGN